MKTESKGLGEFFIRMVDAHAEANDNEFVGQIILFALGIDAFCTAFCKCKQGGYNLAWGIPSEEEFAEYIHTFSEDEIREALMKSNFEYSIKVTRGH